MTGPATTDLLLGIDIGTSRTKAVLIDGVGQEAGFSTTPTPFLTDGDRVQMRVADLRRCLADVLSPLGDARRRVVAVGIAGLAESGAPLDRSGEAMAPVIAWHDARGREAVAVLEREFGPDLSLRIGQPVRTVLTAAKLGWLVDHGLRNAVRWLGVPELCLHALTGAEATEFSLAARTGCYDVAARRWMPEVAAAVGFSVDLFAAIGPAGATMGRVSPEGAAWSGLARGLAVTVAGHDHLAGMAGAGVARGYLGNSIGTAETVVGRTLAVPDVVAARELRTAITVYPGGDEWAALVSAARAGLVLDTAAAALGLSPAELDDRAEGAEPVDAGHAVDDLAGGNSDSLPSGSPGEVWAGILRALTGRMVDAYERLTKLLGRPEGVVVFGGGSVSTPWLIAKAGALDVPVRRSTGTSAVARGAAVHAGVAAAWWPSADNAIRRRRGREEASPDEDARGGLRSGGTAVAASHKAQLREPGGTEQDDDERTYDGRE